MKHFTSWLVTVLMGAALLAPVGVAQAVPAPALVLSSVAIELWPEYDRPTVLVQISGTLDSSVALPASVVVRMPAASGGPLAVATRSADGSLINAPYTTTVAGDQILVMVQADTASFHVEYYDPALTVAGAARTYTFRWTTDYPVTSAAVRVQAPVDSSQLTAEPALAPAGLGDDGLSYYTAAWGALTAGQEVSLKLAYSKATSTLSSQKLAANGAGAASAVKPAVAPVLTFDSPWLWGGVVSGLIVFVGAVWAFWRLRTAPTPAPRSASRRRRPVRASRPGRIDGSTAAPSQAAAGFCTQCGRQLLTGDRFCRSCGTPVRE